MEFKFIPIDYDSFDFDGKNYIRLIGRTEKGEKICVVDSYEPNFWVILKNQDEYFVDLLKFYARQDKEKYFLKTIYPSRTMTKKYLIKDKI